MIMMLEKLASLESLRSGNGIHSFLKKLAVGLACLFALYACLASAQMSFTPNAPAYRFQVLAGSPKQISVDCSICDDGISRLISTPNVTAQAQSSANLTKAVTLQVNVCANGRPTSAHSTNSVILDPAYQQAYQSEPMALQSWVSGCGDETGT